MLSVLSESLQFVRLRMPRDSHTGGCAAVESCLGVTLPTCSVEIGASQHCPKLSTLDHILCFFECVAQEWRLNL